MIYPMISPDSAPDDPDSSEILSLIRDIGDGDSDMRVSVNSIIRCITRFLLKLRASDPLYARASWDWIGEMRSEKLSKRDANNFLFSAILDYRAGPVDIWDNARFFIEEVFHNPDQIWNQIQEYSPEEWSDEFVAFDLHRDRKVHDRLSIVAERMIRYYIGDARRIWEGYEDMPDEIFKRMKILMVPDTTACLVIGALKDVGIATGRCDIRADTPVRRVLARMVCGQFRPLSPYNAMSLARMMFPDDPWTLDRPLYVLGIRQCGPLPRCSVCPAARVCVYKTGGYGITRTDTEIYRCLFGQKSDQKTLKIWQ